MITVSIDRIREITGVSDVSATPARGEISDTTITFLNQQAHNIVANHTELVLEEVTVVDELYDGNDTDTILLDHYPIGTFSSLKIDDVEVTADYYIYYESGKIVFKSALLDLTVSHRFTLGQQNVKASYTYYDSEKIDIVSTLILYLVCIDTWVASGASKSEGIRRMDFHDYELSYDGQPYGSQIRLYQSKVKSILDGLQGKATFGVI